MVFFRSDKSNCLHLYLQLRFRFIRGIIANNTFGSIPDQNQLFQIKSKFENLSELTKSLHWLYSKKDNRNKTLKCLCISDIAYSTSFLKLNMKKELDYSL